MNWTKGKSVAVRIVTDSASSLSDQEPSEDSIVVIARIPMDGQELPSRSRASRGSFGAWSR